MKDLKLMYPDKRVVPIQSNLQVATNQIYAAIPKVEKSGIFPPAVFFYVFADEFKGEFGHFLYSYEL